MQVITSSGQMASSTSSTVLFNNEHESYAVVVRRIEHLETEIRTFQDNIQKILRGEL